MKQFRRLFRVAALSMFALVVLTSCAARQPIQGQETSALDRKLSTFAYIEQGDLRVVTFAHEAARAMGLALEEQVVRGGTDGARLSERGLPTPNIFNGGHDYHSKFEWNTVQNLELSLAYTKSLVCYWAEHGSE